MHPHHGTICGESLRWGGPATQGVIGPLLSYSVWPKEPSSKSKIVSISSVSVFLRTRTMNSDTTSLGVSVPPGLPDRAFVKIENRIRERKRRRSKSGTSALIFLARFQELENTSDLPQDES